MLISRSESTVNIWDIKLDDRYPHGMELQKTQTFIKVAEEEAPFSDNVDYRGD